MQEVKDLLSSSSLLVHFDSTKKLFMSCDASPAGLGVVLSHITDEGEKPIVYVSGTLAPAEKNYSQLEKEELAIIFGVKNYIFTSTFIVIKLSIRTINHYWNFLNLIEPYQQWRQHEFRDGL